MSSYPVGHLVTAAELNAKLDGTAVQSQPTRILGTIYQNTGAKALFVTVSVHGGPGTWNLIFYCDSTSPPTGKQIGDIGIVTTSANMMGSFVVPVNYYYEVVINTGAPVLDNWTEYTLS